MEFRFNVNEYFKKPIVEIRNTLLPPDFVGDRRALWNTVNKVAEVINEMGEASAHAQGLNKPITTAERLRQSDQSLYLLVDSEANNGNGAVTGMLKVGKKGLYVFDREGQHYQVTPPCVLDFYVHEKRQRSGFGKKLFEYMLEKENVKPSSLAIDRPSDKFLNFLNKHYNLQSPVRQMNNYVVFDGFFPNGKKEEQIETSPVNRTNGLQSAYANNSPSYGRYGAPRPPCSMGQIIHNTTSQKNSEPASSNNPQENFPNQQQYQYSRENQQNAQQQVYYPVQNNYQAQTSSNSPQRFNNAHPVNASPQPRVFQSPQSYQQVFNSPQAQQVNQLPEYQFNSANSPQSPQVAPNYGNTMPPQNSFNPNERPSTVGGAPINVPQEMNYVQQAPQMVPQQHTFQDQIRMFPEKEMEARRIPYQNVQYAGSAAATSPNVVPSPAEYRNQPSGQIWPTQIQPQQVYQMSESVPQQVEVPFSQPQPQQFRQQQAVPFPPQSPEYVNGQPATHREEQHQQFDNSYERRVHHQDQNAMPQTQTIPEERYVPQQTYLRQPERIPSNVDRPRPPQMQYNTEQKHHYQPQQQQQDNQERQNEVKVPLDSETVQSLMQVDPKYFKPEPVQIKNVSETAMQIPTNAQHRKYRQEETVDSLLRAEQEVFENGLLRDKYRIPVRYRSKPTTQHLLTPEHKKFCPSHHEGETVEVEQGGYPPQAMQRKPQKEFTEQLHYIPEEQVYENHNQGNVRQVRRNAYPEQAPIQYSSPPQQAPQQQYMPQQQYTPDTRHQDQFHAQSQYLPQEQYTPQQIVAEPNYVRYAPQASPQQNVQREYHQLEPQQNAQREYHQPEPQQNVQREYHQPVPQQNVQKEYHPPVPQQSSFADHYQTRQQYHPDQQLYEPVQNVSQEMSNHVHQAKTEPQQVQYVMERRPEIEENRTNMPTYQEPIERREVPQYLTEPAASVPSVIREPQVQQIVDKAASQPQLLENARQSSYIANDFNPHAEGPGRKTPDAKIDGSNDQSVPRKKRIDRQYGLNDTDMRRKAYKSAIIKGRTDDQEQDTLEFGYPPQVDKKRPPPRNILTMRNR